MSKVKPKCCFSDCENLVYAKKVCQKHYSKTRYVNRANVSLFLEDSLLEKIDNSIKEYNTKHDKTLSRTHYIRLLLQANCQVESIMTKLQAVGLQAEIDRLKNQLDLIK